MDDDLDIPARTPSGRPAIPAVAELIARARRIEQVLDDLEGISREQALAVLDEVSALRRTVRHVDDIAHLIAHDQAKIGWKALGAHRERWPNAVRARTMRARRRHGDLGHAITAEVFHGESEDRSDTGD